MLLAAFPNLLMTTEFQAKNTDHNQAQTDNTSNISRLA